MAIEEGYLQDCSPQDLNIDPLQDAYVEKRLKELADSRSDIDDQTMEEIYQEEIPDDMEFDWSTQAFFLALQLTKKIRGDITDPKVIEVINRAWREVWEIAQHE